MDEETIEILTRVFGEVIRKNAYESLSEEEEEIYAINYGHGYMLGIVNAMETLAKNLKEFYDRVDISNLTGLSVETIKKL